MREDLEEVGLDVRHSLINRTKMKKFFKIQMSLFFLATIFSFVGCSSPSSWLKSIPKADIVFQIAMNYQPYTLGFIRSDGSNFLSMNIVDNFVKLVWGFDGTTIYGLSNPSGQPPYEEIGYPAYWDVKTGKFKRCFKNISTFDQIEGYKSTEGQNEVILNDKNKIIVFDLDTCKQIQKLVDNTNNPGTELIIGFSYFPGSQELIYGEITDAYQTRDYHLIKLDLITGKRIELAKGINPSWSPDGKNIAFIGLDGLYVVQANSNQIRDIIKTEFFNPYGSGSPWYLAPQPRWSPDGKWLVYHQCLDKICEVEKTPIFITRVSDGMQVKIFTGGKFPTWMP